MGALVRVLGVLLCGVVGFVAGGFVARFFLISDTTGFAGAATVFWAALVGTVIGLVAGYLALRR
ncbi:MAG: DUF1328 domain-containing protein [Dehalococcoidia bacterium]|nr:DUF1328 domain-containing protein [Dehalococcoidia bacterium]